MTNEPSSDNQRALFGTNLTLGEALRLLFLLCGPPWLLTLGLVALQVVSPPQGIAAWLAVLLAGPAAWGAFISAIADGRTLLGRDKPAGAPKQRIWQSVQVHQSVHIETVGGAAISTGSGTAIAGHIVNLYLKNGHWTEDMYSAALDRYLQWVCAATGKVVLPGIKRGGQQVVELSLDDVYIPLEAEALPDPRQALKDALRGQRDPEFRAERGEVTRTISMHDLLAQGQRLAVIGAPGCGKTSVLQHIAWTLAEALRLGQPALATNRLGLSGELPLPIYVPLSLYAEHRRKFADHPDPKQRQLATFVNFYLLNRQAGLDLPPDFFVTLLNQGRHVILLLDGLDEVPSDDERALVSQAVQDLTYGREQTRFIVTSRTPAYQGKAVLGADFRVVRVLPISPKQVADLIAAAYRSIYPKDVEQDERLRRTAELTSAVKELEEERQQRLGQGEENRLVTTPLLVRMLLIVYFNLRRLPDQRAELYMEMVDTLLTASYNPDEEVAQRLAQLGGDWRSRRDMAQTLAYAMHSQGETAGRQIAERPMAQLLDDYLIERRYKTAQVAQELVADFVANSRQRGGLLEEQDGWYRFSHLSFQEFLTARYLAEGLRQVERVTAFLEEDDRVLQSWWREPALLTIGYLSITAQDAAVELIHQLAGLSASERPHTVHALAGAELAGAGFLEWGGADTTRQALAHRLAELLQDAGVDGVSPSLRALAGRTLGRLGDLRPGVGLRADGVPDIAWCPVPAGEFVMGEGKDQHIVNLDAFAISKYPITTAQFDAFVHDGGYTARCQCCWTEAGWEWKKDRSGPDKYGGVYDLPNHPVVVLTWYEAVAFCSWLGQKLGQQVSLPTEAQWERAARHTDGRRYSWGDEITPDHANTIEADIGTTSAVGIFPKGASECGALDMSGNVWEWCQTKWRDDYSTSPNDDPEGGVERVVRGGSFYVHARLARCAVRYRNLPFNRLRLNGFRVVVASP